jgi:GR25 family glycosyltransferase involved in LPS biosynthesis
MKSELRLAFLVVALVSFSQLLKMILTLSRLECISEYALEACSGVSSSQSSAQTPSIGERVLTEAGDEIRRRITRKARSFVISLNKTTADEFLQRNKLSMTHPVIVIPGLDGWKQESLDIWGDLLGEPARNISNFNRSVQADKDDYNSPHAVGCYLAHWNLWRTLYLWQKEPLPQFYSFFEDDTTCAHDMYSVASETAKVLPADWDILYIGGKPFTYFRKGPLQRFNDSSKQSIHRDICRGAFGSGQGPLAPDGSRNLAESQPYWKADYVTNTDAYIINPQRLKHLVHLMKPQENKPIDIRLAERMSGEINAYMTTRKFCDANGEITDAPKPWIGMYAVFVEGVNDFDGEAHPALRTALAGRYLWGLPLVLGNNCSY